jgi:hypothetical protein
MKTLPSSITALIGRTITAFSINQTTARTTAWRGDLVAAELAATGSANITLRIGVSDGQRRRIRTVRMRGYSLLFAGDCPQITDAEAAEVQKSYEPRSLATLNLSGTVKALRQLIDTENLNPLFADNDRVMAFQPPFCELSPVYPEVPSEHAAVLSLREQAFRSRRA